jgi:hypothetical protein
MKSGSILWTLLLVICFFPASGMALIIHVPGDYSTIQTAMAYAPEGSTILVAPGTYPEAMIFFNFNKTLYIKSTSGPASTIVHGGGTRTLLKIMNTTYGGKDLTFEGFTFTQGRGETDTSPVTICNARPAFINCNFENNSSPVKGGAVLVFGASAHPSFTNSQFRNNQSDFVGGAVLVNGNSAQASFENCLFEYNTTRTATASTYAGAGALQFTEAGGSVVDCTFRNNSSTFVAGAIGVYSHDYSHTPDRVTIQNCHFENNFCAPMSSENPPMDAGGGAIHIEANVIVDIQKCYFGNNYAISGGAVSNYRAQLSISDTVFDTNRATGTNYFGVGGAIAVHSYDADEVDRPDATLIVKNTMIRNGIAPVGGGIHFFGDTRWNLNDNRRGLISLENVVIENCLATKANLSYGNGGGLNLDFANLTANGLLLLNNTAEGAGGGILINQNTSVTLTNAYIIGNQAAGGAAFFIADSLSPSPILNNTVTAYNQGDATANLAVLRAIPSLAINDRAYLAYILAPYVGSPSITPDVGTLPDRGGFAAGTAADPISSNITYQLISSNYPTQTAEVRLSPVTTLSATKTTFLSAVINGSVYPDGLETSCFFQWGTTGDYGNSTSVQPAGNGTTSVPLSAYLSNLTPNTLYHYRLVCNNSGGTYYGQDVTFKTVGSLNFLQLLLDDD